MAGNSIGVLFRVTTWGESHGKALGAVVDGCPPDIELTAADIQRNLSAGDRGDWPLPLPGRRRTWSRSSPAPLRGGPPAPPLRSSSETGTLTARPMKSSRRSSGPDTAISPTPGNTASAITGAAAGPPGRETVARVAAGAIAKKVIARAGIEVIAYTQELGGIPIEQVSFAEIGKNDLSCPDAKAARRMEERLEEARAQGDSLGGIVAILVKGCPAGLGEPVFDKIDADLAKALMGIGTVKGVEIGAGFQAARMTGSENNDPITSQGFATNHAGGILAGITNGDEIVIRVACKPIPSIEKTQETIDNKGKPTTIAIHGRHDVAVIPRIIPVCEAMVAIVLADHLMRQQALDNSKGA